MKFTVGNLFDSNVEALVNTVNTVGVMGKGVALQFKERFPTNYKLYVAACSRGDVQIGKVFVTSTNSMINPKWIFNFPTKRHWMHKSSYEYISSGLDDLIEQIQQYDIKSIAIPPLGAGQGGLDWGRVKQIILEKLENVDIEIIIYEPSVHQVSNATIKSAKLTKPRAMILSLIAHYKKLGYDISLLEIQKIAYFLQRMGQSDLKLNYKQYLYGPYAHNLQHLLHELENGFLKGEKSVLDSKPFDLISLNFECLDEISQFVDMECRLEEKQRLQKMASLMSGYESPFGLELLSTVDWILNNNKNEVLGAVQIKDRIKEWSRRKDDNFNLEHVRLAQVRLQSFAEELGY